MTRSHRISIIQKKEIILAAEKYFLPVVSLVKYVI